MKLKHKVFNGGRMRIYPCNLCNNYHLTKTSQTKDFKRVG